MYCFKPKMEEVPDGDWFCFECQNKVCLTFVWKVIRIYKLPFLLNRTQLIRSVSSVERKENY